MIAGNNAFNRIYNHRPFLDAQLQTMAKNFDSQDCHLLKQVDKKLEDISENIFNSLINKYDNFNTTADNAEKLENMMKQILDEELKMETQKKETISKFISQKNEDLVSFMEETNSRIDEIDNFYIKAKEDIDTKFKSKK